MDYDGTHKAMTNQASKQAGVLRRFGLMGAVIVAACLAAGATFLGYGVDANLPWPVTANTTIAAKYCGGTVLAGRDRPAVHLDAAGGHGVSVELLGADQEWR